MKDLKENQSEMESIFSGPPSYMISSLSILIKHLEAKRSYNDTLKLHFTRASGYWVLDLKSSGFESLKSSGLDILKDAEMRINITNHFNQEIPKLKSTNTDLREDFYAYILQYIRLDFKYVDADHAVFDQFLEPIDYNQLLKKNDFLQSLKIYESLFKEFMEEVRRLHTDNIRLQKLIADKIKKNE